MNSANCPSYWNRLSREPLGPRTYRGGGSPRAQASKPEKGRDRWPVPPSSKTYWKHSPELYEKPQLLKDGTTLVEPQNAPWLPVKGLDDYRLAMAVIALCKMLEGDQEADVRRHLNTPYLRYQALHRLRQVQRWRQRAARATAYYEREMKHEKRRGPGELKMPGGGA